MRASTAHVRACRGSKEPSHEAATVSVAADFHLLRWLADRFERLLLFKGADLDVAVVQRGDGRRTARLIGESEVVRDGRDSADGGGCAS